MELTKEITPLNKKNKMFIFPIKNIFLEKSENIENQENIWITV